MSTRGKQAIVVALLATALAVGGGAALAGSGSDDGQQAFLDAAAKRLGVTSAQLKAALAGAYGDRLDAAVAAGTLTQEQADAMKARAKQDGGLPFFGHHREGFGGHRGGPRLAAVASYLGITAAQLRTELESGKTLAEIAKAHDKTVGGLEQALSAELKAKLDAAVEAGRLTQAQATEIEARMASHLDDLVNGRGGPHGGPDGGPDGDGDHGWGGGPPPAGTRPPAMFVPVPAGAGA